MIALVISMMGDIVSLLLIGTWYWGETGKDLSGPGAVPDPLSKAL